MGVTARQQRVFDKPQSVDKSMKEAVVLQEKNQQKVKAEEKTVYAKAKDLKAALTALSRPVGLKKTPKPPRPPGAMGPNTIHSAIANPKFNKNRTSLIQNA